MRLARKYGSINEIENLPADKFMDLIHYENYLNKYKESYRQLNKKVK